MPDGRQAGSLRQVEELLCRLNEARALTDRELSTYDAVFIKGWEVPGLCGDPHYRLRLLIPIGFPFTPPRVGVSPAPSILSWPHLEDQGLLCLLTESAHHSIDDITSVVIGLLKDAADLVLASLAGDNFDHFEDEFHDYWCRWNKTTASMSVICRPEGPSRWVSSWHGKLSTFVADDEATLHHWLQNRYDGAVSKKIGPQPIPLLWLARPLQPSEYPRTVGELLSVLKEIKIGRDMVEQLLLDEKAEYKSVMLGFTGRRGSSFAGLRLIESSKRFGSGRALSKGFRGRPPAHILLTRYRGFPVVGARVFRFDGPWVHGRDHNPHEHTLATKSVIVLGVGSVGGSVAELLAKSGVGTLILVDHDLLASENLGRHALGAQSVGDSKARALAKSLSARFPHLTFKHITQSWEGFANAMPDCHRRADLVISTMGCWRAESMLNALANQTEFPPVLYGWTEPHAVAGHAAVFFREQGCLRCLTDALGHLHIPVSAWPEEGTMLPVPACGGQFQPYGAVELTHIHGLVADLALDVLLRQIAGTTHRIWIGQRKFLERTGGRWHQAWIERHGNPGKGGMLIEAEFHVNPTCPECGSIQ